MLAAALILSTFGTGVDFGWQPMPDDSQRREYVVQLEPEMVQELAAGTRIPIVSEVPDAAQPIGRIRIVVGRGDLPRDGRVTLKPADAAESNGAVGTDGVGIQLTQYTEPAASRYAVPTGATPRYATEPVAKFDPYTQVPPTTAAAGAVEGAGWNGGAVAEVADARGSTGPLARVGQGLQQMAEPVRNGVGQIDNQLRAAADNLGDRTRDVLDTLHPNRPGLIISRGDDDAQAAATAATAAAAASGVGWNGGAATSEAPGWNGGVAADSAASEAPGWNGGQTAEAPGMAPLGASSVETASAGDEPPSGWNHDVAAESDPGAARRPNFSAVQTPSDFPEPPPLVSGSSPAVRGVDDDPWANVADERLRTGGRGTADSRASQPRLPAENGVASTAPRGSEAPPPQTGASGSPAGDFGFPAITREMFDQSPWRPFDGLDPGATAVSPAAASRLPLITPTSGDAPAPNNTAATPATFDAGAGSPGAANQPSGTDARSKAAVILAWVLLTGSIAGNLYLFWSYLDVRTKYRALVRKTARAVGSRFSAA